MAANDKPVVCAEGAAEMCDAKFKAEIEPGDLEMILFSNDVTIDKDTVRDDLTEITGNGLDAVTLAKASFAAAAEDSGAVKSVYNSGTGIVWAGGGSRTLAATIYGWAICFVTSGKVYLARNWGQKVFQTDEAVTVNPVAFGETVGAVS